MNPSNRLRPILALAFFTASAAAVSAVTITNNHVGVSLQSSAGYVEAAFTGTSIPSSQLLDVTQGEYYSRTQIDYTGSGNAVTLMNTLSQKRSGLLDDYSLGRGSSGFTVAADSTYSLSGAYGETDVSTAGAVTFESSLYDVTTSSFLFRNYQQSSFTPNENFVLGGIGGDSYNYLIGSLTGSLIAGHQYRWRYDAYIYAYPDSGGGATATGYIRLDIGGGSSASVPDGGSTFMLLGLTLLSFAAFRRKVALI